LRRGQSLHLQITGACLMMKAIIIINGILSIVFAICYIYQYFYVLVGFRKKYDHGEAKKNHHYAAVISARNESQVLGNLIESIKNQSYPRELIDIYVIADNCTDDTADIARAAGATVFERFNTELVGKGYALNWFFNLLKESEADNKYDAFIVFDADNVLDTNFIYEMNKVYDKGYRIITSYRNSKNYGENWITAGYSLWFLREARYLNNPRMQLGTSCAISGTGFLVASDIIRKAGGWVHHLLTEDIEFTVSNILDGEKIGYCGKAVLYDEQPNKFRQSYLQRLRWAKGFYQVFKNYGWRLMKGMFRGSSSCYDILMTIMPAMLLTCLSIAINILAIPYGILTQSPDLAELMVTIGRTVLSFYALFFILGAITTITEWKQIHCHGAKKILYLFTFPIFMLTYVPIAIVALFRKVKWVPIEHSVSVTLDEICEADGDTVPEANNEMTV